MLYINFEDERLTGMNAEHLNLLLEVHLERYGKNPILFLDEIQKIPGWEKFARRMADTKHRVYITGSNVKMLSQDIQSTLGGPKALNSLCRLTGQRISYHLPGQRLCVLQSCLDLIKDGYEPVIVEDCAQFRNPSDKIVAIRRMQKEGATITKCESIHFKFTRYSGNENFKKILKLVK